MGGEVFGSAGRGKGVLKRGSARVEGREEGRGEGEEEGQRREGKDCLGGAEWMRNEGSEMPQFGALEGIRHGMGGGAVKSDVVPPTPPPSHIDPLQQTVLLLGQHRRVLHALTQLLQLGLLDGVQQAGGDKHLRGG